MILVSESTQIATWKNVHTEVCPFLQQYKEYIYKEDKTNNGKDRCF